MLWQICSSSSSSAASVLYAAKFTVTLQVHCQHVPGKVHSRNASAFNALTSCQPVPSKVHDNTVDALSKVALDVCGTASAL
jgi:hypothetical protein